MYHGAGRLDGGPSRGHARNKLWGQGVEDTCTARFNSIDPLKHFRQQGPLQASLQGTPAQEVLPDPPAVMRRKRQGCPRLYSVGETPWVHTCTHLRATGSPTTASRD